MQAEFVGSEPISCECQSFNRVASGRFMPTPTLVLISEALPSGRVELTMRSLPVVLGRSHSADLTIADTELSRRHAEIRINSAGQFELVDLDSTNLSIVNCHDVSRHILTDGDQIVLGETEIRVELVLPKLDLHDQTTKDLPLMG